MTNKVSKKTYITIAVIIAVVALLITASVIIDVTKKSRLKKSAAYAVEEYAEMTLPNEAEFVYCNKNSLNHGKNSRYYIIYKFNEPPYDFLNRYGFCAGRDYGFEGDFSGCMLRSFLSIPYEHDVDFNNNYYYAQTGYNAYYNYVSYLTFISKFCVRYESYAVYSERDLTITVLVTRVIEQP